MLFLGWQMLQACGVGTSWAKRFKDAKDIRNSPTLELSKEAYLLQNQWIWKQIHKCFISKTPRILQKLLVLGIVVWKFIVWIFKCINKITPIQTAQVRNFLLYLLILTSIYAIVMSLFWIEDWSPPSSKLGFRSFWGFGG